MDNKEYSLQWKCKMKVKIIQTAGKSQGIVTKLFLFQWVELQPCPCVVPRLQNNIPEFSPLFMQLTSLDVQ